MFKNLNKLCNKRFFLNQFCCKIFFLNKYIFTEDDIPEMARGIIKSSLLTINQFWVAW